MGTQSDAQGREEVVRAWRAHVRALTEGDTEALEDLLDEGFTLTHMSGYVQPKEEWLAQMRAGWFDYHDVDEKSVSVEVTGGTAHLVGRTVTDATVHGVRAPWHLQLAFDYARRSGTWTALRAIGTSW
ncbi:nuclear transport factor 2 family protein [Streptomyces fulvoviolaceus]|uniref:nuclear transport factor 2 family protein n=1 Tax=Streptomyces fulvoviolaceus TaxID=285535 RepID=UPI0006949081|nr:nuclear transport factor 2 family protein [Streptomyces fulvoviolaceus]